MPHHPLLEGTVLLLEAEADGSEKTVDVAVTV